MGIWGVRNEPPAAYPAPEFVPVECVCSVHDEFKIIERILLPVDCRSYCTVRVSFVKPCQYALLFRPLEVQLPPFFGVRRLGLVFLRNFFPFAKDERGKANVDVTVFYSGYLCLVLLMDTWEILRIFCRNPFSFVLLGKLFASFCSQ